MALVEQFGLFGIIPLSPSTSCQQPVYGGRQDGWQVMLREDQQGRVYQLLINPQTGEVMHQSDPLEGPLFNQQTGGGWRVGIFRRIAWRPSEALNTALANS